MSDALIIGRVEDEPLRSCEQGLQRLGFTTRSVNHLDWRANDDAGLVVIYGVRAWGRDILDHYANIGTPVVLIDLGFIDRAHTAADLADGYLYVGVGRLGKIADVGHDGLRAARLKAQSSEPRTGPIRRALICGQVEFDASHRLSAQELVQAYEGFARALRVCGIRDVHFRPHPLERSIRPNLPLSADGDIREVLSFYDIVCSINSNAGLDALLMGLPVVIAKPCHYQSLAYTFDVDLSRVRPPPQKMVNDLIRRLSYSQWTLSEISEGAPFDFLMKQGKI